MAAPAEQAPPLSPEEEQEARLTEAVKQVKGNAFHMKRALDKGNLHEALKFCSAMLSEMRTSNLSPQKYYELYIKIYDELMHLESYFLDEVKRGTEVEELYEIVQHAGNIVPRMYLLITIGSVYIKSKQAPAKDILRDLVEMCKGVQHPTRGLFMRNYLLQMAKNKLPDKGNEYEGEGGAVDDSVEFIIQNFNEMVRLWVRMETKNIIRDKDKREKERKELRILVGFNLVRLSQLEGVDLEMYRKTVLPNALDIIIQSKDVLAQQYLMEVVIQVFPDEFHLSTLKTFLDSCMLLHQNVDLRNIFTPLLDRLGNFAQTFLAEGKADQATRGHVAEMAGIFTKYIGRAVEEKPKVMTAAAFAQTQLSLMHLVLKAYPNDFSHVNAVLAATLENLERAKDKGPPDAQTVKLLKKLLAAPIDHYQNVIVGLQLQHYPEILALLPFKARRDFALDVAQSVVRFGHRVESIELVTQLFVYIGPLVADEPDAPEADPEEFAEEQNLVARLVHLLWNDSPDVLFRMYSVIRKQFGTGGPQRMQYTLTPLVFSYLRLAVRIFRVREQGGEAATKPEKIFQYVLEILGVLRDHQPEHVLRVYLQVGTTADACRLNDLAYEAFSRALTLYEEEVSDSKKQIQILTLIIATLQHLKNLNAENTDTLSTKACQYSSKLLKKPDQCVAAHTCSHLFWSPLRQDGARVLECLQRALKIVENCMPSQQTVMFVMILNEYIYYYNAGNDKVLAKHLDVLTELIETNITKNAEDEALDPACAPIKVFYTNTKRFLKRSRQKDAGGQ